MSERLVVTFPDKHIEWLERLRKKKGLGTTQDVVRLIVMNEYERSGEGQNHKQSSSEVGTLPSESKDDIAVPGETEHREGEKT